MNMVKRILSPHLTIFKGFDLALNSILLRIFTFILSLLIIYCLLYDLIYTNIVFSHVAGASTFNTDIPMSVLLVKFNIFIIFYLLNLHNINILTLFFLLITCVFFLKKDFIKKCFLVFFNKS